MSVNANVNCHITIMTSITKKKRKKSRRWRRLLGVKCAGGRGNTTYTPEASPTSNFNLRSPSEKFSKIMPFHSLISRNYFIKCPLHELIIIMCMFSNDQRCFLQYLPCVKM